MVRLLKFLLNYKFKTSKANPKIGGFTLIELLVGLILAFLIITPLLGFVVNIMNTDRQEQAKSNSEQEIQAALDYIARDLDQSFFIYDGLGLANIKGSLKNIAGGTAEPVLVFWKRQFLPKALPINSKGPGDCNSADTKNCDDTFVYSLVVYYLIPNSPPNCTNQNWSCTARIGRMQLTEALYDLNNNPNSQIRPARPSGFDLFTSDKFDKLKGASLEEKLNSWTYTGAGESIDTLIDYIDQSTSKDPGVPQATCPDNPRAPGAFRPDGVIDLKGTIPYEGRTIPQTPALTGFYACVDTDKTVAQVFIRGNALARTLSKGSPPTYQANKPAFFPRANIQAQGRGLLNQNQASP
ncbi:MAG TPA: hormogonium polysaccharide secretion pseudopilin HpsC [Coleofasciculaceae cyanobacterium]|jgi:type II secretory pathway pseudopilin PulG